MKCHPFKGILAGALVFGSIQCQAAEPPLDPGDLGRVPPTEPADALKTFRIKKGFHLQLVAAEPLVINPIAMSFDENGRLFVVEMRDYPQPQADPTHRGRIRLLEDTNHDGVFDKATIYADGLSWPSGVFCYGGGVFVAASPDILYLKDTKGDGHADLRKVVFTGFGAGKERSDPSPTEEATDSYKKPRLNVQELVNGFVWGLDNRIHGQTSGNGGVVGPGTSGAVPLDLKGRDFFIEPRLPSLGAEAGGGQYGISFDDYGRRFVCSNSRHIQMFMYDASYARRNPILNMPGSLVDIPADGPAAPVFRISPEESWRVVRTRWRVAGKVQGPVEAGGKASGYFTSASGITIFRGDHWPRGYEGDAFIAEPAGNLISRKRLEPDGVGLIARRPPDELDTEFLASTDNWFRPVQIANGPDGTLYVADMYREIIEHPWSLPEPIKQKLDLTAGNDRGRIYRILPDGFRQPKALHLGRASTAELVADLENPNGWIRDTASRLLYERQDMAAVHTLTRLSERSKSPLGRIHALHAIYGLGHLKLEHILPALGDREAAVREHAVKLSERLVVNGQFPAPLWTRLASMSADPAVTVRYQLAFTLGEVVGSSRLGPLTAIARRDFSNSWMRAAILSSLADGASEIFSQISNDRKFSEPGPGREFLQQLVNLIGAANRTNELDRAAEYIAGVQDPAFSFALVRSLGTGLEHSGGSLALRRQQFATIYDRAAKVASDTGAPLADRQEAVRLLGLSGGADAADKLLPLLDPNQPAALQLTALSALGRLDDRQIGPEIARRWPSLTPRLRAEALNILLARPERASELLLGISRGVIRSSDLQTAQEKFLRHHADPKIRLLASQVLDAPETRSRSEVIDNYMPALSLAGDATHGRNIYRERCMLCHRLAGQGSAVGPDLVTVQSGGKEKMLVNILDPNREVRQEYVSYVVETDRDESWIGVISSETASTITLRQPYGKEEIIPRSKIRKMWSQGQSLMPEGLESGLSQQDLADLLEYVQTAR
jgi:putative membrane-bound dehydrogenase-like protein